MCHWLEELVARRNGAERSGGEVGYRRETDGDERKDEGVAVVAGEAVVPIVDGGRSGGGGVA
jgi:hypothetical protein